jgi:hypothetical protein
MTGGGVFLGFQPPSAGARSPSLLGEKTKCESVPRVGERSPNAEGAAPGAGGLGEGRGGTETEESLGVVFAW